jgi:hypothetical protein
VGEADRDGLDKAVASGPPAMLHLPGGPGGRRRPGQARPRSAAGSARTD